MTEIKNAIIKSAIIDMADRDLLNAWVNVDYGGTCQGFGGYVLYLPKSYSHHEIKSVAGHFIYRCMEIAGVDRWDQMTGKTIRVSINNGLIKGIGHIVNDDWLFPSKDFENV